MYIGVSPFESGTDVFSAREREVIAGLSAGESVKEIATRLNLTVNTVKDYLKTIYSKAHVHSARELLVRLYGVPHDAGVDGSGTKLLHAIDLILSATHQQEVARQLLEGARVCTGADRIGIWRWTAASHGGMMVPIGGGEARPPEPVRFLREALDRGAAQFRAVSGEEAEEMARLGLGEQALALAIPLSRRANFGPRRDLPPGHTLMLLSKSEPEGFLPLEVAMCGLLTRLAAMKCGGNHHEPES